MENITLKDLKTMIFALKEKLHQAVDDTISVYYSDVLDNGNETQFYLSFNDKYIFKAINLYTKISQEDIQSISKDIVEVYRNSCDLSQLDMKLRGEVPCQEFEGIYSTCDDCPRLKNCACFGVSYKIQTKFDDYTFLYETHKKWSDKYGYKSDDHKELLAEKLHSQIGEFYSVCKDDDEFIYKILSSLLSFCGKDKVKRFFKKVILK